MSHTTTIRPGEAEVPAYRWVAATPDAHGGTGGCGGCGFRRMPEIRCSRIPCQTRPGLVAELITAAVGAA